MTFYLYCMDGKDEFPPVEQGLSEPNGLLAFGGDLSVNTLVKAYSKGIFPWFSNQEPILWWSPDPRMVLFPDKMHISRSFKKALKKTSYQVFYDRNFEAVINACAQTRKDGNGTWITEEMQQAYIELYKQGFAHCLEIEIDGQIAGGMYGVALENIFYGESMFSRQTNGSKFALYELCQYLIGHDYKILDCQAHSDHLETMGAEMMPLREFKKYLPKAT